MKVKCDQCGIEYSDPPTISLLYRSYEEWAELMSPLQARGLGPCPLCKGEMIPMMNVREVVKRLLIENFECAIPATDDRPVRWHDAPGEWYKLGQTYIVVFEDDFRERSIMHGPQIGIFEDDTKWTIQPCDLARLVEYLCFDYLRKSERVLHTPRKDTDTV